MLGATAGETSHGMGGTWWWEATEMFCHVFKLFSLEQVSSVDLLKVSLSV